MHSPVRLALLCLPLWIACGPEASLQEGRDAPLRVYGLQIAPLTASTSASGAPITFVADLQGSEQTIFWALEGPGSLSTASGTETTYLPPALTDGSVTHATVNAFVDGTALRATAQIRLDAHATLGVDFTAPFGTHPELMLTGPNGFEQRIIHATTLTLEAGDYALTAAPLVIRGEHADQTWSAPVQRFTLQRGQRTSLVLQYRADGGTGRLWYPCNSKSQLIGLDDVSLRGGSDTPSTVQLAGSAHPTAIALDTDGSIWALDYDGTLTRQSKDVLQGLADPSTGIRLSVPVNEAEVTGLTIDHQGTLWVVLDGESKGLLLGVPRDQQQKSGVVTPKTLTCTACKGSRQARVDSEGALWLVDDYANQVVKFDPDQLDHAGLQYPSRIIATTADRSIENPEALAFDAKGDLWIANESSGTVSHYGAGQLEHSGALKPIQTVKVSSQPIFTIAFDQAGDLWAIDSADRLLRVPFSDARADFAPDAIAQSLTCGPAFDLLLDSAR